MFVMNDQQFWTLVLFSAVFGICVCALLAEIIKCRKNRKETSQCERQTMTAEEEYARAYGIDPQSIYRMRFRRILPTLIVGDEGQHNG